MGEGRPTSEAGQTLAGYAILIGAIAVGCAFALLFLGGGVADLWESDSKPIQSRGPFLPPTPAATIPLPTTLEACVDPGWATYDFTSLTECEEYVRSHS